MNAVEGFTVMLGRLAIAGWRTLPKHRDVLTWSTRIPCTRAWEINYHDAGPATPVEKQPYRGRRLQACYMNDGSALRRESALEQHAEHRTGSWCPRSRSTTGAKVITARWASPIPSMNMCLFFFQLPAFARRVCNGYVHSHGISVSGDHDGTETVTTASIQDDLPLIMCLVS
jgi:hypothetical protein